MFSNLKKDTLHHAYLIEGDSALVIPELEMFLETIGVSVSGNSNVFVGSYESFLMDDAKDLKQRQIEKSADGGTKIFIIDTQFINHHAQNALLKTFEEPSPDTHFFVIMPSIRSLYTTLVSRFMVLGSTENIIDTEEAQAFLKLDISKKLLFIADIIKAHESDDNSGALRAHATRLISGVETLLYESSKKNNTKLDGSLFQNFANAKKYLDIAGASVKMILEQIALVV